MASIVARSAGVWAIPLTPYNATAETRANPAIVFRLVIFWFLSEFTPH